VSNVFSMSKKTYRPYQPNQLLLLPPALQDWLPHDHFAYFLSDVVDSLDLSQIERTYERELRGYPPYHPRMMVKVLLYAYCNGVYSSRKIERRLQEDVAFRVLAANNQPDFRTISDFRKRHLKALTDLFLQVVKICKKAGLVRLGHVALDGTKIKANASKHKAMSYSRMVEEEQRLKAEIAELLQKAEEADQAEDDRFGPHRRGDELPEELRFRERRLAKIQEAKAALEAEARLRAGAEPPEEPGPKGPKGGRRRKRSKAEPAPTAQRNFTDPDSRIMKGADKQFIQGYNAQAVVDADTQIIVAAAVTNQAADAPHLIPMMEQVEANVDEMPEEVSADAGYFSEQNVQWLLQRRINPYIPPEKQRHIERRCSKSPRGPIPKGATLRDRMRRKLQLKRHAERYRKREQSVEPVFGQIKEARGFRQFHLRGLEAVNGEWVLVCLCHNLLKLYAFSQAG
jgi:transposase/IS5 family transposase